VAKIKHTRNENGQNVTHQNKTTLFWRKKAKINLHQNFPIDGIPQLLIDSRWREWKFRSDDFNLANWNCFLVSNIPLSRTFWKEVLRYRISWEIYTPYARTVGVLLHINGKFTMGKLKSFSFSLLISSIRPRYEADLAVSVVSFISSSIWWCDQQNHHTFYWGIPAWSRPEVEHSLYPYVCQT
jgi:hypothetical protein